MYIVCLYVCSEVDALGEYVFMFILAMYCVKLKMFL